MRNLSPVAHLALAALLVTGCSSNPASPGSSGDGGTDGNTEPGDSSSFPTDGAGDGTTLTDSSAPSDAPAGDAHHGDAGHGDAGSGHDGGGVDAGGITVPTCAAGERPFLLRNQCSQPVQVMLTPGATGASCTGNSCALGTCNTSNGLCYWSIPSLGAGQGALASGASQGICFAPKASGQNIQWSGNLAARLGCSSSTSCPPQPVTLAEFTLADPTSTPPGTDFYDVSIINGADVAMEMAPIAGTFTAQAGKPYSCGAPGATSAAAGLGACSWNITPTVSGVDETTFARAVAPGGAACTSDANCTGSDKCGLGQNGANLARVCGAPLGWWTADQVCGVDPNFGAPYDCATTVQNSNGTTSTYTQMFGCIGPEQGQSCYSNGATQDCCGCGTASSAWPQQLGPGFSCKSDNPRWQSVAEPWLAFLKQACPTAYTYPFDDATSTFTCAGPSNTTPVAYAVTFCP